MQSRIPLVVLTLGLGLAAQGTVTVPASYASTDAASRLWVAGFSADLRQQTIVGASHLQALLGRDLIAVRFRRDADPAAFAGGSANLVVQIGTTATAPLAASQSFAANLPQPTQVFAGSIAVPASPPAPGPNANWDAQHSVRIPFSAPFRYLGGSLVLDISGTVDPTAPVEWWPADAAFDPLTGSVHSVGTGCGVHANAAGEWASVAASTLLAGGTAQLSARGTEQGLALLFLGAPAQPQGMPLEWLVPGALPGCHVHLPLPAALLVTTFANVPFAGEGGVAIQFVRIPNQPWVLGASFGTQWVDVQQQFATSNAVDFTIAAAMPSLDLAVVRGVPGEPNGIVLVNQAHVLQFEFQ